MGLTLTILMVAAVLLDRCSRARFAGADDKGGKVINMIRRVAQPFVSSTARVSSSFLTGVAAAIAVSG